MQHQSLLAVCGSSKALRTRLVWQLQPKHISWLHAWQPSSKPRFQMCATLIVANSSSTKCCPRRFFLQDTYLIAYDLLVIR